MEQTTSTLDRCRNLQGLLFNGSFDQARDYVISHLSSDLETSPGRTLNEETVTVLRLKCMAAEVLDYWGRYRESRQVIATVSAGCEEALERLADGNRSEAAATDSERHVARQQLWVVLQTGMTEYRRGDLGRAAYLFGLADRVCSTNVITSVDQAWGTRARIAYCTALIHRERLEFKEALSRFTASVNYGYNSLKAVSGEVSRYSYINIARSLALGLAYVHNTSGRPDLAFPLLVAAKSILTPAAEKLVSCYVDLLRANVLRGIEGSDGSTLDAVTAQLQQCYVTFREAGHTAYQARAAYNLAVAHLQHARPDETVPLTSRGEADLKAAETYERELKLFAGESQDLRAEFRRQVLKSRIARKKDRLQDAERIATRAIEIGNAIQEPIVDALIARGEARARMAKVQDAALDFELALKGENFRTRAICLLHLCRLYCTAEKYSEATRYFAAFQEIRDKVTNSQVVVMEGLAQSALQRGERDLILRISDTDLTARGVESRVRRFLSDWARSRVQTDAEAARLLQISRQTFYNWVSSGSDSKTN